MPVVKEEFINLNVLYKSNSPFSSKIITPGFASTVFFSPCDGEKYCGGRGRICWNDE